MLAIGEPAVVVAWPLGVEGRKRFAGTALYSAAGMPIASRAGDLDRDCRDACG